MPAQVAFVIDIHKYAAASLPTFVQQVEEVRQIVARQLPISDGVSVNRVVTGTADLFDTLIHTALINGAAAGAHTVTGITTDQRLEAVYILNLDPTPTIGSVAGGAAGALTVSGVASTSELKSAVTVDDTTHAVVDITATTSITGTNTINTGAVDTTGKRVVITFHAADITTLTDTKGEYVITANTITNTGGTSSDGKQLFVIWRD